MLLQTGDYILVNQETSIGTRIEETGTLRSIGDEFIEIGLEDGRNRMIPRCQVVNITRTVR